MASETGLPQESGHSVAATASASVSTAATICSSECSLVRKNRTRARDSWTAG